MRVGIKETANMKKQQRSQKKVNVAALFFTQEKVKKQLPFACKAIKNGFPCAYGNHCKFPHNIEEVRKAALSRKCKGGNSCWHKDSCLYLHPKEGVDNYLCRVNNCSKVDEIFRKVEYEQEQEIYNDDITKGDITKLVPSQVIIKKRKRKISVISCDYDGCGNLVLNETYTKRLLNGCYPDDENLYQETAKKIEDKFRKIDSESKKVIWVNGSTRQSYSIDQYNRDKNSGAYSNYPQIGPMSDEEGSVFLDTERYIENIQKGNSRIKTQSQWELYKITQADRWYDFSGWNNHRKDVYHQDEFKQKLVMDQIRKLNKRLGGEDFVYHFFDDREDILEKVKSFIEESPGLFPDNIEIVLHHFCWHSLIKEKDSKYSSVFWTRKKMTKPFKKCGTTYTIRNCIVLEQDAIEKELDTIENVLHQEMKEAAEFYKEYEEECELWEIQKQYGTRDEKEDIFMNMTIKQAFPKIKRMYEPAGIAIP